MVPNQRSFLPPSTVPLPHFNSLSHTLPSAAPPRRPPLHHALPEATSALPSPNPFCIECSLIWLRDFEDFTMLCPFTKKIHFSKSIPR